MLVAVRIRKTTTMPCPEVLALQEVPAPKAYTTEQYRDRETRRPQTVRAEESGLRNQEKLFHTVKWGSEMCLT